MNGLRWIVAAALVVGVSSGLAACTPTEDAGDPTGAEWTLTRGGESDTDLAEIGITAIFNEGQISGFSGVNQYSGPFTADETGGFESGPFTTTLMAGPEPLMKVEQSYLELLEGCDSYAVMGGMLILYTDGDETLTFEVLEKAELPGSTWTVTGYNNGNEAVTSVAAGSTLTIEFGTDETVSGNAGVNTYSGPFETTGSTIAIGPLVTTRMAGPEELMTQETLFLEAMQAATSWRITQSKLELRDDSGALQITATAD